MTTIPPKKRLYDLKEAAVYMGRSEWSMRRLIYEGLLPAVRVKGRIHVDVADMDRLIEDSKTVETSWQDFRKDMEVMHGSLSAKGPRSSHGRKGRKRAVVDEVLPERPSVL